ARQRSTRHGDRCGLGGGAADHRRDRRRHPTLVPAAGADRGPAGRARHAAPDERPALPDGGVRDVRAAGRRAVPRRHRVMDARAARVAAPALSAAGLSGARMRAIAPETRNAIAGASGLEADISRPRSQRWGRFIWGTPGYVRPGKLYRAERRDSYGLSSSVCAGLTRVAAVRAPATARRPHLR